MIHAGKKWGIWFVYLPILFMILFLFLLNLAVYAQFPTAYFLLLILAVVVGMNPVRHHYTYYSFLGGLSLAAYVISGLFPEILLSSLGIIVLVMKSDMKLDQHYRYPLYLIIITCVSFLSAGAYQSTAQLLENTQYAAYQIVSSIVYMCVQVFATHVLQVISARFYLEEKDVHLFDQHFKFLLILGLIMLPLTYAMLYMYFELGILGLLLFSIPYLIVAIGTKYYYRVFNHRQILLEVNRYSRRLSKKTSVNAVIESFVEYLIKLFPVGRIAFSQRNEEGNVVLRRIYEKDKKPRNPNDPIIIQKDSPIQTAMENKEMIVALRAAEWQTTPISEENYFPESVVVMPIHMMAEEKGVLLMTHPHQGIYDKFFVSLIEVFYMYVQIILNNAYNFERLEEANYTDFLTGLPNYRGFATYFDEVIEEGDFDSLSLIILDLDHFKRVNDMHGHEAGNEVLKEIAALLNEFKTEKELVARYGGEEFVILLKDVGREKAFNRAEQIRVLIEKHTCRITQSIQEDNLVQINITASIGVATYPDNCSNVYDLVKLADDTMYTKSKQGGRNRVSEYNHYESKEKLNYS